MKITRFAPLAVALASLSVAPGMLAAPTPAICAPAAPNDGLPPGTPPLTAGQRQQQKAVLMKAQQEGLAIRDNNNLSSQQKLAQSLALRKSVDDQMMAILTPAQRAAVESQRSAVVGLSQSFNKQHQQELKQRQQVGLALSKSISPAQRGKMKAIQDAANKQLQALETNPKMTQQEKMATAGAIERDAASDALAIFTPAQQAEFKQFKALNDKLQAEFIAFAKAHHTP